MKLFLALFATVFGEFSLKGGRCYHNHGKFSHEVPVARCKASGHHGQTCESVAHHSNGCPLELNDYECTGAYCKLDGAIGGPAWDGEPNCGCEVRLMSEDDIAFYAEEGLGVDGVSGTATGIEFSSSFDFCYQQCMGKISEDSTFEPCPH